MTDEVKSIKLSAEYLGDDKVNYDNLNTDVIVEFKSGERFVASFYSINKLKDFIKEVEQTDDYKSGQFYRLMELILVKDLNTENLYPVIESMLNEGDFQLVFRKI